MKIAIQRQIIDTENIYSISEVYKNYKERECYYNFDIESFGDKFLTISVHSLDDLNGEQDKLIAQVGLPGVSTEYLVEEGKRVRTELP